MLRLLQLSLFEKRYFMALLKGGCLSDLRPAKNQWALL